MKKFKTKMCTTNFVPVDSIITVKNNELKELITSNLVNYFKVL